MRMTIVAALAASSILAGCSRTAEAPAQASAPGEVPITLAAGGAAVLVPVHVNGAGPYHFVLDTGATLTCIDQALAERLELPQPVGLIGHGTTLRETGTIGLHRIDRLNVGSVSAARLTACAIDLQRIEAAGLKADGLLGLNFLKAFKVTVDFDRKVLTLAPPGG